jgi:hypothetical protein
MARAFSDSQTPLLKAVLNRLVPPGGDFPGAGELDLLDHLDRVACASPAARRTFVEGVRQIALESERRHGQSFEALASGEQDAVLRQVEADQRVFFEALVSQVYQAYYNHPTIIALLELEARPPQPLGHALPPFDAAIMRSTSGRAALYRRP